VTGGCTAFLLGGEVISKHAKKSTDTSMYGVLLMLGYLGFDGFTSTFQDKLFKGYKMETYNQMLYVNLTSATVRSPLHPPPCAARRKARVQHEGGTSGALRRTRERRRAFFLYPSKRVEWSNPPTEPMLRVTGQIQARFRQSPPEWAPFSAKFDVLSPENKRGNGGDVVSIYYGPRQTCDPQESA